MIEIELERLEWNSDGLIPAVIQDAQTKQVLMVAYMNKESLKKTIATKQTWFWSRSRQELWNKGATSGSYQYVEDIQVDCDADTLLVMVEQIGVACHTGTYSCFGSKKKENNYSILNNLIEQIKERDLERPEGSYTTYLLEQGLDKILKKVGEEASEVIIAAKNESKEEIIYEASDLIYHMLVLLHQQGVPLEDILFELEKRHKK